MNESSLSVVMPVYNEEAYIDAILPRVLAQPCVLEVIAVDDGSSDGSRALLRAWAQREPRLTVVEMESNGGKGRAVRRGLELAGGFAVVIQDADLEYDPEDYPALLAPLASGEADVVYGSRFGMANRFNGPLHRWGNRALSLLARLLTGWKLTDEATCYKTFRTDLTRRIHLREDGFGFCPEITVKLSRLNVRFHEVPIHYRSRTHKEGKKLHAWTLFEAAWCLVKYRLQAGARFLRE